MCCSDTCCVRFPYKDGTMTSAQVLSIFAFIVSTTAWMSGLVGLPALVILQFVWCRKQKRCGLVTAAVFSVLACLASCVTGILVALNCSCCHSKAHGLSNGCYWGDACRRFWWFWRWVPEESFFAVMAFAGGILWIATAICIFVSASKIARQSLPDEGTKQTHCMPMESEERTNTAQGVEENIHECFPYRDATMTSAKILSIVAFVVSMIIWFSGLAGLPALVIIQVVWCCKMNRFGLVTAAIFSVLAGLASFLSGLWLILNGKGCYSDVPYSEYVDCQLLGYITYDGWYKAWASVAFVGGILWLATAICIFVFASKIARQSLSDVEIKQAHGVPMESEEGKSTVQEGEENIYECFPYRDATMTSAKILSIVAFLVSMIIWFSGLAGLPALVIIQAAWCCKMKRCGLVMAAVFSVLAGITSCMSGMWFVLNGRICYSNRYTHNNHCFLIYQLGYDPYHGLHNTWAFFAFAGGILWIATAICILVFASKIARQSSFDEGKKQIHDVPMESEEGVNTAKVVKENICDFFPYRDATMITAQILSILAFIVSMVVWFSGLVGLPALVVIQVVWCCKMKRCGLVMAAVLSVLAGLASFMTGVLFLLDNRNFCSTSGYYWNVGCRLHHLLRYFYYDVYLYNNLLVSYEYFGGFWASFAFAGGILWITTAICIFVFASNITLQSSSDKGTKQIHDVPMESEEGRNIAQALGSPP